MRIIHRRDEKLPNKYSFFNCRLCAHRAGVFLGVTPGSIATVVAQAETKQPFARLVELAMRKGFKNVSFEALCHHFQLASRAEDSACQGYQLSSKIDDADAGKYGIAKDTGMMFNVFVEKGTGIKRIMIGEYDTQAVYAFLINQRGQLLKAMMGPKAAGDYRWHLTDVTSDVKNRFSKEISYWVGSLSEIEQLPDL
jgi:hypothetical protein